MLKNVKVLRTLLAVRGAFPDVFIFIVSLEFLEY